MITIVQQPGEIALSRNPMVIEFQASDADGNAYTPKGVRSELNAAHTGGLTDGETLTVDYTEPDGSTGSVTFTAYNAPDNSNVLHIRTKAYYLPVAISSADYWEDVAEKINAHPEINRHFKVYSVANAAADHSLWIEVVELDDDWELTWDESGISSSVFTVNNSTTSLATTAPDNYAIFVDIFFESEYDSDEFDRISQHELPINSEGKAYLDLSEIIWPAIKDSLPEVPLISAFGTAIQIADNLRNYYYRYREDYDAVSPSWTVSDNKKAMAGGITQDLFATTDFLGTRSAINSILTWYPPGKSVGPDQPEWLNWYNFNESAKKIAIELKTWTDLSDTPTTSYKHTLADPTVEMWEVAKIPVGPEQISIGSTIKKYTVQVIDQEAYAASGTITYLSEARSYYIDRLPQKEVRYIVYENGFCLPEILRCTGEFNDQLNIQRQERTHVLPVGYTNKSQEISQWKEEYNNRLTFRTGYIGRQEVEALQELLIYNRSFEVEGTTYIPLHIEGNRYQVSNTNEFLNGVQFVAIRRLKDKIYRSRERAAGYIDIPAVSEDVFSCDITLAGSYASIEAAETAGIVADEYYAMAANNDGIPEGLVFRYNPTVSYNYYSVAVDVADDKCYPISTTNWWGLPKWMVRRKNATTTYDNHAAAATGGVALNEIYALSDNNDWGLPEGFLMVRLS